MDYLDGFQYSKTESPNSGGGGSSEMFSARAMQPHAFSPGQSGFEKGTAKTADLQFLPTAEGFTIIKKDQYIYSYTDHLGNIRLSYFNNGSGAEVLEENNYYPFGLKHEGYNVLAGNSAYQYKYNGVELQEESGMYAMDWRQYMPDLGRFSGMDMLSESYIDSTPYHFGLNNPITFSDPTGMYTNTQNGYLFTRTDEIAGLQQYFGNGGSIGNLGGFISGNATFKDDIQEVIINVNGKGNKDTWNLGGNYLFNSYAIYNAILAGLNNWNFQTKAGAMSESLVGVRNDRGIMMIGGYGDPLGLFDIGGLVISTWEPRNRYLAMAVGVVGAIALKKPGLAVKEADGAFYSITYEMKLAEGSYTGVTRYMHFKEVNIALESEMLTNSALKELRIIIPRSNAGSIIGKSPTNWVWHHEVEKGVMQLVPKSQHPNVPGGIFWETLHPGKKGGFSIWGKK